MSAHKKLFGGAVALLSVCVLIALGVAAVQWHQDHTTLTFAGHTYHLEVARTTAAQDKGLGDRTSMAADAGMLFVFQNEGTRCFWMKDMHFPLDMVWVDGSKHVRYIAKDVPVNSYPDAYCPNVPAQYVIELNAGQATSSHLYVGEALTF